MAESPVKEMDVRTNKGNLCCYYLQYSMGLHGHTLKRVQVIFLCALNHLLEDIGTSASKSFILRFVITEKAPILGPSPG